MPMSQSTNPIMTVGADGSTTRVILILGQPMTVRTTPDGRVFVNGDEVNVISKNRTSSQQLNGEQQKQWRAEVLETSRGAPKAANEN